MGGEERDQSETRTLEQERAIGTDSLSGVGLAWMRSAVARCISGAVGTFENLLRRHDGGRWRVELFRERNRDAISTAIQSTDRVVSPDAVTGHLRYWFHFHSSRIVYPTTTSLSIQYTDKYVATLSNQS